ncbi:MAG: lipoate--protein ligase [Bacteroidales bacterium]|nr:lipoate--protein ligase [Bacteroidales bacterium]
MIRVLNENTNPYFNLAAEEYLLKSCQDEVFMLWRCSPTVVVGKHQNTLAEINSYFVREKNIGVARRLTGGGAVYHDGGNINFTFIVNGEKGKLVDFGRFLSPVISMIGTLGLTALPGPKNEILLGDKKISGNAEHIFKTRILHHGTLLFNTDLNKLRGSLNVMPGKYFDKSVQSNRSSVTNISAHLKKKMSPEDFIEYLYKAFSEIFPQAMNYVFTNDDINAIQKLAVEKYQTWEWIYGYSPKYSFVNSFSLEDKPVKVNLEVEQGMIKTAKFDGSLFTLQQNEAISELFIGKRHEWAAFRMAIEQNFNIPFLNQFLEGLF